MSKLAVHPSLHALGRMLSAPSDKGSERGKFRSAASLESPVYLDHQVRAYLSKKAAHKGVSLNDLVNDLLRREIEIIETVK
jgi:predicted HicB family RNase H-like nuclease